MISIQVYIKKYIFYFLQIKSSVLFFFYKEEEISQFYNLVNDYQYM